MSSEKLNTPRSTKTATPVMPSRFTGTSVSGNLPNPPRVLRTPPRASTATPSREIECETEEKGPTPATSKTLSKDEERKYVKGIVESKRGSKSRLEYAIELTQLLSDFMHGKSNMHMEAKNLVTKVLIEVKNVTHEVDALEEVIERKNKEIEALKATTKRDKRVRSPESPVEEAVKTKKHRNKENVNPGTPLTVNTPETWQTPGTWQTVEGAKKRKKKERPEPKKPKGPSGPKPIRRKPEALIVGLKEGGSSYAEILSKMKSDPTLKEMGEKVKKVRNTRNGEMLFEFKPDEGASEAFKDLVKNAIGEEATVKSLSQLVRMECTGLDSVTTPEELQKALTEKYSPEDPEGISGVKLRKTFWGTQTGSFKVPAIVANKMIDEYRLKIGWSVCHIHRSQEPMKCYKCMGYGHQAKQCKGENRANMCWKCGQNGHKARLCKNPSKCVLCSESEGNGHWTGSVRCKAYIVATRKQPRWQ